MVALLNLRDYAAKQGASNEVPCIAAPDTTFHYFLRDTCMLLFNAWGEPGLAAAIVSGTDVVIVVPRFMHALRLDAGWL